MRIYINVKTKAKQSRIEKVSDNQFRVWVKELPVDNKANLAVVRVLAEYFDVPSSMIRIAAGAKSKKKSVEIIR